MSKEKWISGNSVNNVRLISYPIFERVVNWYCGDGSILRNKQLEESRERLANLAEDNPFSDYFRPIIEDKIKELEGLGSVEKGKHS